MVRGFRCVAVFGTEGAEIFDGFFYVFVVEAEDFEVGRMVAVGVGREVIDRRVGMEYFARSLQ